MNTALGAVVAGLGVLAALALWPVSQATRSSPVAAEASPPTVAPATRDVTPSGIVPGPAVDGPLTRVEVAAPPPPPARWHRFFRPVIVEAGLFEVKGKSIRLSGVDELPVGAMCTDKSGAEWSCGRAALMELRRLVRGRAIECNFSSGATEKNLVAPCRVATTDIALWLAGQGWARPAADASPEIRAAVHEAACAGRGIWRDRTGTEPCA